MIGSWYDWELTELGKNQANKIGFKLSNELNEKHTIYTSDLLRAKQTAEIISQYLDIRPREDSRLREFNLGEAIGKTKNWARENNKTKLWAGTIDWGEKIDDKPFNGCESKRDVWNRLLEFMNCILSSDEENIIIVSHDGTLSLFFAMWLGLDVEMLDKVNFTGRKSGVSFLREDENGNRIIDCLNDTSYIS